MQTMSLPDLIGFSGVFLLLLAYFLLQSDRISSKSALYSLMNLVASLLILVSLVYTPNIPSITIQLIWSAISIYGLVKVLRA